MTIDMVGYTNHFLSMIHQPPQPVVPKRWVSCEMCDGQGYCLVWTGSDGWREEVERTCEYCDDGYVEIEEGDTLWDEGEFPHPNDRGR